jgi:PKD domain
MFVRLLSTPADLYSRLTRGWALAAAFVAVIVGALSLAAPAGAVVAKVETGPGKSIEVGLQPRTETLYEGNNGESFANDKGNTVVDGSSVYAIYWDPNSIFHEHHEWLTKIDTFFQAMGDDSNELTNIFSPLGQYRDRANEPASYNIVYKGSYSDTTKYPTAGCTDPEPLAVGEITCLTNEQLRAQLQAFISEHSLPKGMHTIYYLMTPPGVTVCLESASTHCSDYSLTAKEEAEEVRESESYENSFCSYHSDINPDNAEEGDSSTILYAAIPWTAGTAGDTLQESSARVYESGYDCQDGGWNPEKHEENREQERSLSPEEETKIETEKEPARKKLVEELRLEGPHEEEPNQEGKGEEGDYSPGLADLIINQIAEEQANTVTDPLLNGWQNAEHLEVTDECRDTYGNTVGVDGGGEIGGTVKADVKTQAGTLSNQIFGSGNYYINNVFNLASLGKGSPCAGGVALVARFTAPNPVKSNEVVSFDGLESTLSLLEGKIFGASGLPTSTYATFNWNYGDGTETSGYIPDAPPCELPYLSPCAGSALHTYQYGGTYTVTLTVTDVAGNTDSISHEVTVVGPPKPSPEGPGGTSSGTTSVTPAAAPTTASTPNVSIPAPVAAATIVPQKLKSALRKGLVVTYSVNEQVAGRFEVLLSRSLAHRLGISGTPATGLPAGSPAEVVIAKSILVTTKGGRSAVHIKFSKSTAARLARAKKVPLMLRLIVRNSASTDPATTTVLSALTLAG